LRERGNGAGVVGASGYRWPMTLQPDHKALVFVGAIAVLGAGVRVMRAATAGSGVVAQPGLDHQLAAADSARAQQAGGRGASKGRTKGRRGRGPTPPADRSAVVHGKLDLDVATAAQVDSLPGVTPTIARRIVADRLMRGPFMNKDGLRRVTGVGPNLIQQIDTLVTFSGTLAPSSPADTVIVPRKKPRARPATPPVVQRRSAPPRAPLLRAVADSCWLVPVSSALRRRAT
jgi:DNA uptake protein ComE-like DNA-binding protein